MQWKLLNQSDPQTLTELQTVLLTNRGLTEPQDVETFFKPLQPAELKLAAIGFDTTAVNSAVKRIQQAINRQEKVVVFGDYDADGICATAVMWLTLHQLGCQAIPFIPDRLKHGYGLSTAAIEDLLNQGKPDLIVTVDNGIVAHQPVAALKEAGVEVIITDHHSPEAELPAAHSIVHTTQLCGTTVAWMFGRELVAAGSGEPTSMAALLDLCAIATIADQVPLLRANRSFAYWGIEALKISSRPGIKALCAAAEIVQPQMTTNNVHFGLAPRINAMGRLEHGLDALRLLCTTNVDRATQLASSISLTNVRRQTLTEDLVKTALAQAQSWENEHLIVVSSPDYHEGVIGLIAGKLMETYFKPAIVIAEGESKAKASARSIAGVNIVELIRLVRDDLLEVGGHPMAAGFGLLPEKIAVVKERLLILAKDQIHPDQLVPQQIVECQLPPSLVTEETVTLINRMAPFGQGNAEPVVGLHNYTISTIQTIGQVQQHLKLSIVPTADVGHQPLTCLGWGLGHLAENLKIGSQLNVAGCLELNEWKNRRSLQLKLKDVQISP